MALSILVNGSGLKKILIFNRRQPITLEMANNIEPNKLNSELYVSESELEFDIIFIESRGDNCDHLKELLRISKDFTS
jgi:hypothetical protein|tara:strand:+ start:608 stop:841 length:234 start_codon:yes stop_codon:yes gene_type:complete